MYLVTLHRCTVDVEDWTGAWTEPLALTESSRGMDPPGSNSSKCTFSAPWEGRALQILCVLFLAIEQICILTGRLPDAAATI